ncbi:hypothetical protein [Nonomuraea sp. NPDC050643]
MLFINTVTITTDPLPVGRPVPEAGAWEHGAGVTRYVRRRYRLPEAER